MPIQTRNSDGQCIEHITFLDALRASRDDVTIWKISFQIEDGTRIRLVRDFDGWVYENVMTGYRA